MLTITAYENQNQVEDSQWIVTSLSGDKWLLVLTGKALMRFEYAPPANRQVKVMIYPNLLNPYHYAMPPQQGTDHVFYVEQYTTLGGFAGFGILLNGTSLGGGFDFHNTLSRPIFQSGSRILAGVEIDFTVGSDIEAVFRISYQLTAVGRFKAVSTIIN